MHVCFPYYWVLKVKVNVGSMIFNGMGHRMHQDKKIHAHTHVYFPQYRALTSEKRKYLKTERPHRNTNNISEFFNPNKR